MLRLTLRPPLLAKFVILHLSSIHFLSSYIRSPGRILLSRFPEATQNKIVLTNETAILA
jgi:hypothetical protein